MMKKTGITISALLLTCSLHSKAQDGRSNTENKNDKTVLEEHKNGGKKDESNTTARKSQNGTEAKDNKKAERQTEKREIPRYDKKSK